MMFKALTTSCLLGAAIAVPTATTSKYPPPPPTPSKTCHQLSANSTAWTVENFSFNASYIFSTPAHQNSWGYVNFDLVNDAVPYKPVCQAASDQLSDFFYGTVVYTCAVPGESSAPPSTFTFSRPDNTLNINQTWDCSDEGSAWYASGGAKLDLKCTESDYQNPNWTVGSIYSSRQINCGPTSVPVPITSLSASL